MAERNLCFLSAVDPRYITQYPVCPGPPPVAPPIYPPPVAPPNIPHFKVYIGKIAPTVDNNFVISLLQVCGVVKSWEPVRNPIDGTHTGFGFCEFESAEGCHRAWRLLNKLSIDGQELVLNVDQATRDAPFRYSDTDKDAMERIRSMIEERTKTKLPRPPTLAVQVSACTVDNGNDDAQSSALEERKTRRQCENEEHLGGMKDVGSQCKKDREVTAAVKSSLQIDEAPLMHVRMERESAVEHESKNQHRKRDGFRKSNVEEKGRERKAVGWDCWKDREVSAAGKSSLRIDEAPSRHVPMECESAVEHARKNQHRKRDGVCKSNGEEKRIVFVPGLVSDKQNTSAGEKVALELRATSKSGEKKPLDAKQLLATVPKMKEELFAHDVNWAIYDKYGLHDRMRPWISKKTAQVFDEELAEFVDYVVAATEEHVTAPRMLELLESLLDDDAERFVLLMWRKLIFEIKKVEEGLA
uniref:Uncharacterized protein n=1 Tax=Avena sativa TaxID=4498 RepID=A0ACD5YFK9_AVESA